MSSEFDFEAALSACLAGVCPVTATQAARMASHYDLLKKWNQHLNLTSIRKPAEIVERHYCESVFLATHLGDAGAIVDVGTGPGFPGIPLAIMRPESPVALIESHQRKAVFLREATRDLKNVRVIAKRAEAVEEFFDLIVSRAVDPLEVVRLVPKLARGVAILIGSEDASRLKALDAMSWAEPVLLPWGRSRVLLRGVSPGTVLRDHAR